MRRRRYLAATATGAGLLAGCTDSATPTATSSDSSGQVDRFERNLDEIPDPDITRSGDVVRLTYSVADPSEEVIRPQVRNVAVGWANVVGAGWNVDRLEVEVTTEDVVAVSYHIEAEWASQFNNKEITATEYGDRIDGTVVTATPPAET